MDLQNNIDTATLLPWINDDASFIRLQGLSQAEKDRRMNQRKVQKPQNIKILEDSDSNDDDDDNNIRYTVRPPFEKDEIIAAIKEVNGGRDLSNKHWEEYWYKHLQEIEKSKKQIVPETVVQNITNACSENQSETKKDLINKSIKYKNKLSRNAAIMGLINTKQISMEDLIDSRTEESAKMGINLKLAHATASATSVNNQCKLQLVPLSEDPEVFVHPLQIGLDSKKFTDIDFTIPRIGKKKKITPQEYFLKETTEESFNFVKKEKRN